MSEEVYREASRFWKTAYTKSRDPEARERYRYYRKKYLKAKLANWADLSALFLFAGLAYALLYLIWWLVK